MVISPQKEPMTTILVHVFCFQAAKFSCLQGYVKAKVHVSQLYHLMTAKIIMTLRMILSKERKIRNHKVLTPIRVVTLEECIRSCGFGDLFNFIASAICHHYSFVGHPH